MNYFFHKIFVGFSYKEKGGKYWTALWVWGFSVFVLTNQAWAKYPTLYYVVYYKSASDLIFMIVLKRNPYYKHKHL